LIRNVAIFKRVAAAGPNFRWWSSPAEWRCWRRRRWTTTLSTRCWRCRWSSPSSWSRTSSSETWDRCWRREVRDARRDRFLRRRHLKMCCDEILDFKIGVLTLSSIHISDVCSLKTLATAARQSLPWPP